MESENIILLLTACINPNCNDLLAIKDVETRKTMYIKSIQWYLQNTDYKIIFCENSGTDISSTFPLNNRIEFITYKSNNTPDKTKGYKEMEILEYILKKSKFISQSDEATILVKITGRLIALNIKTIISKLKQLRGKSKPFVSAYLNGRKPWSDSRFIFFSISYFPILISYKEKINKNYYFEHVVTESTKHAKKRISNLYTHLIH